MIAIDNIRRSQWGTILMAVVIIFLPLFKGGNYPGVLSLFTLLMCVIFCLSYHLFSDQKTNYWLLVWLVFSVVVAVHAYLIPLAWDNSRFFVGEDTPPSVFLKIYDRPLAGIRTVEVWSHFTLMWMFAWVASVLSMKHVKALLVVVFFVSLLQALFGIIHFVSDASSVLGLWTKEHYLNAATGTFVNKNHFAGMLAITTPLVLVALLNSQPMIFSSLPRMYRLSITALYLLVIMLALITSHSRMGIAAALFGIVVCVYFIVKSTSERDGNWKATVIRLFFIFLFLSFFGIWFGLEDIVQRYVDLEKGNSRLDIWAAMFDIPLGAWLVGVGPGLFEDVFQIVKPEHFSVRFIFAHNDYLEFFFEFGLVLGSVVVLAVILWFSKVYKSTVNHPLRAGMFGSIAAVGLHSLVDFNLQVIGSALFFWLVIGLLVNTNVVVSEQKEVSRRSKRTKKKSSFSLPKTKREWLAFLRSD